MRPGSEAARYATCAKADLLGEVYPVNPARDIVQGCKSLRIGRDLPTVPDVAIIAVPADGDREAIERMRRRAT